jgi:hypothetical protein
MVRAEAVADTMMYCASCGMAEVDDIKLQKCDACDLVQYCSDNCQQEHWPKHDAKLADSARSAAPIREKG